MKTKRLTPRQQGDIGELSAMEWLASKGAHIYVPVGHSPDVDVIAELSGRLLRVEVKSSAHQNDNGTWAVLISTRGGNQSWTGLVKYFEPERCDYLFVHVGDGRRWFIPSGELDCRSALTLGGPKYSEFEVEPGRPLGERLAQAVLKSDCSPGEYPSGQRTAPVKRQAQPSQVRILPPPSSSPGSSPAASQSGRRRCPTPVVGRTQLSANHQLTIPLAPFEAAELEVGDRLRVEVIDKGRVLITRLQEYTKHHMEQLGLPKDDE
jgi:PD-(D/E)XK endonuclease